MNKRNLISAFMCSALLLVAPNASAQFFKKLGKAIQEVDKALGGTETKTGEQNSNQNKSVEASQANAKEVVTENGIYVADFYTKRAKAIRPFITSNTKVITIEENPRYGLGMGAFEDGMAFVSTKKEKFFIDSLGNKAFQFTYTLPFNSPYPAFCQGVCPVHENSVTWLINKKGEKVVKLPGVIRVTNFVDGVAAGLVLVQKGYSKYYKLVHVNTKGQLIFPNLSEPVQGNLEEPRSLCDGLAAFYSYKNRTYGFRDKNGKVIVAPVYIKVQDFSDGMAAVQQVDGKWGFIDTNGNVVITPKYTNEPSYFGEGYAVVKKKDGTKCFIDKQGNVVHDNLQDALPFHNGHAFASYSQYRGFYTIGKDFKPTSVIKYDDKAFYDMSHKPCINFGEGMILYKHQSFMSPLGDELINASLVYMFSEGLAICHADIEGYKDSVIGYINKKGEFVAIFKETEF